jgi:hypothetical protein
MTDQSELSSRATLCRRLAQREPDNRTFWMAEAEHWSRLSKEKPHGEDSVRVDSGIFARLREKSTKFLFMLAQQALCENRAAKCAPPGIPVSQAPVEREQLCGERSAI